MGRYEAKIPEIKERIVKEINPEKIILFGSYAWGEPTEDSDVDLLVIQKSKEPRKQRQIILRKKISSIGVPVDMLVYTPEEMKKSINENRNLFIEDIVRNGKILYEKSKDDFGIVFPLRALTILH
jgi:predicted nucleotidyltransferase